MSDEQSRLKDPLLGRRAGRTDFEVRVRVAQMARQVGVHHHHFHTAHAPGKPSRLGECGERRSAYERGPARAAIDLFIGGLQEEAS